MGADYSRRRQDKRFASLHKGNHDDLIFLLSREIFFKAYSKNLDEFQYMNAF